MLSLTSNALKSITSSPFNTKLLSPKPHKSKLKPVTVCLIHTSNQQQPPQLYQPFRPPPSPIPERFRSLDVNGRIDVLRDRLGLWYEYAPLIPSLYQQGFTPPSIEESTGISSIEQNRLIVGAKVRDSLVQAAAGEEIIAAFETGGSELLYEIRLLSVSHRTAAAAFIVKNRLDTKGAEELARAIKDFPSRKTDRGWRSFNYNLPGDCLAFLYYRQSKEYSDPSEQRTLMLQQAIGVAESENAKSALTYELEGDEEEKKKTKEADELARVPVVRLQIGEVAESSSVYVFPVCRAEEKEDEIMNAPWEFKSKGEFGIVEAEKEWKRWVVLPGWTPVALLRNGGVVVAFSDGRALPWKVNKSYYEEATLVVADRGRKVVDSKDGFFLVNVDGGGLKVERGVVLKEKGIEACLGAVVLVVRPPKEENDQLPDEDWD